MSLARHVVMVTRLVCAGYGAALQYAGEEVLKVTRTFVATDEEIDDGEDDEEEAAEVVASLTGLDAERWVNDLRPDYHAPDEPQPDGNCGEHDCRWCWVNATGATG